MEENDHTTPRHRRVTAEDWYATLMEHEALHELPSAHALDHIMQLVDVADHLGREEGLERAIAWGAQMPTSDLPPEEACRLNYYLGNAWAALCAVRRRCSEDRWAWEQPEVVRALVHYRRALPVDDGEPTMDARYTCRVLTNLANQYSSVGRFIVAVDCWTRVLDMDPNFGMARGNRGVALGHYAAMEYDPGHACLLRQYAYEDLEAALNHGVEDHARPHFETAKAKVEQALGQSALRRAIDVDQFLLGDSDAERAYRGWCLRERLFLNTLNDLGRIPISATDVLHAPSMVAPVAEIVPVHHALYNQMKQEYVSARYLLYEGTTDTKPHFADAGVLLYNTLDYPALSLNVEKVRLAFRAAYSLLDKVAYFLNSYFALGLQPKGVNFRTIWYEDSKRGKGLRSSFAGYPNWPLRGLFWLSKDLVADGSEYQDAIEPDARELAAIRNHLEHKYLQVHEYGTGEHFGEWPGEDIAFRVSRTEFERKTLRLMRMARAALIYLSLAIHVEERRRASQREPGTVVPGVPLDIIEDDWKR